MNRKLIADQNEQSDECQCKEAFPFVFPNNEVKKKNIQGQPGKLRADKNHESVKKRRVEAVD
jgi:hypothetical protein